MRYISKLISAQLGWFKWQIKLLPCNQQQQQQQQRLWRYSTNDHWHMEHLTPDFDFVKKKKKTFPYNGGSDSWPTGTDGSMGLLRFRPVPPWHNRKRTKEAPSWGGWLTDGASDGYTVCFNDAKGASATRRRTK
jgi:hypothetical protein